jgi:hypothetical protein
MLTKSLITIVALTLGATLAQAGSSGTQTDGSKIDISNALQQKAF